MSKIPWTGKTFNPIVGCTKCSLGCDHCYAEIMAWRQKCMGRAQYNDVVNQYGWTGNVEFVPGVLEKILKLKKPQRIFIGSMTDIFHPDVPFRWVNGLFGAMAHCPDMTFQILTKRSKRMVEWFAQVERESARCWPNSAGAHPRAVFCAQEAEKCPGDIRLGQFTRRVGWPLPNVHLGVTACDQAEFNVKVRTLLECPAAVHYVSLEPLLESISTAGHIEKLDWVIAGGENGRQARLMPLEAPRLIRDACIETDTPFFFKGWGSAGPMAAQGDRMAGQEWKQFPKGAVA